jgi:VIT1/CCC1 family predicted Fe2+/Mn2+ transporter
MMSAPSNLDRRRSHAFDLRWVSFGSPAAIVTSMALIVGLGAETVTRAAIVGSLLIIAVADNLTDSLSVHIYQESERLAQRQAFRTTLANYAARLGTALSFVALFIVLPPPVATYACVAWGFALLSGLTYLLARARNVKPFAEIIKHAGVAVAVILIGRVIGMAIRALLGAA